MSEFEFRESPDIETGRIEREGLPPGYRMRADAHYVDALAGCTMRAGPSATPADSRTGRQAC